MNMGNLLVNFKHWGGLEKSVFGRQLGLELRHMAQQCTSGCVSL